MNISGLSKTCSLFYKKYGCKTDIIIFRLIVNYDHIVHKKFSDFIGYKKNDNIICLIVSLIRSIPILYHNIEHYKKFSNVYYKFEKFRFRSKTTYRYLLFT